MNTIFLPSDTPVSVVTGATGDLGGATTVLCAQEGHFVIPVGRDSERLDAITRLALDNGAAGVLSVAADLTTSEGLEATVRAATTLRGGPLYLFNIAGSYEGDDVLLPNSAARLQFIATKVTAPIALIGAIGERLTAVVYSSSQAEALQLSNSKVYGLVNRLGSNLHMEARMKGVDAKTVLFGNIAGKTANSFRLTSDDVVPLQYAAMTLLHVVEEPQYAAKIVLPKPSAPLSAPDRDRVQEVSILASEVEGQGIVANYSRIIQEQFAMLERPRIG